MSGRDSNPTSPRSPKQKPTFFQRLFGRSKSSSSSSSGSTPTSPTSPDAAGKPSSKDRRHLSSSDAADQPRRSRATDQLSPGDAGSRPKPRPSPILAPAVRLQTQGTHGGACDSRNSNAKSPTSPSTPGNSANQQQQKPPRAQQQNSTSGSKSSRPKKSNKHRKRGKKSAPQDLKVDVTKPLEFPTTPELILAHHKVHPFLNKNEEWLLVELNEFECLVDSLDIIKIIAKHSKFFEVEPDELWEEFFEFVDDVPSYDEVINFDVWQEFRDNKYPC